MTINETLVLLKMVRERISELRQLRQQCAVVERNYFAKEENKVTEPQYDVKAVDKKIVELENFVFLADSKIKQANAVNTIDLAADVQTLLAPLS